MPPLSIAASSTTEIALYYITHLNFPTIICIVLFFAVVFSDFKFLDSGGSDLYVGKEDKSVKFWKVGFFHFIFGGLAVPQLISLFGKKGFLAIMTLVVRTIFGKAPFAEEGWFASLFSKNNAIGAEIAGMLIFYIGLYFGVIYSLRTIKKFYQLEKGKPVIYWSLFFMIAYSIVNYIYYTTISGDAMQYPAFNFIDQFVRVMIFFALTKWHMYRIVITDIVER
jgi:hypothetical protein